MIFQGIDCCCCFNLGRVGAVESSVSQQESEVFYLQCYVNKHTGWSNVYNVYCGKRSIFAVQQCNNQWSFTQCTDWFLLRGSAQLLLRCQTHRTAVCTVYIYTQKSITFRGFFIFLFTNNPRSNDFHTGNQYSSVTGHVVHEWIKGWMDWWMIKWIN